MHIYQNLHKFSMQQATLCRVFVVVAESAAATPELRYLNISNCQQLDDMALDQLQHVRDSLTSLDISGCLKVTERGISSLHRLK